MKSNFAIGKFQYRPAGASAQKSHLLIAFFYFAASLPIELWSVLVVIVSGKVKIILIVDDDEDFCTLCRKELRYEGYITRSVSSGPEALRFVDREPQVELIILDVKMHPLDGFEVLNRIRKRRVYIPVILYSAYPEYRRNITAGFSEACLEKSSDLRQLKQEVKKFLIRERPMT
jgi:CheY-like chemotaxis protein